MGDSAQPLKNRFSLLVVEETGLMVPTMEAFFQSDFVIPIEVATSFSLAKELLKQNPDRFFMAVIDGDFNQDSVDEILDILISRGVPPLILTSNYSEDFKDKLTRRPILDYVVKRNMSEMWYVSCVVERVRGNVNRKVLIVDDSPTCRMTLSSFLKRQQLQVIESESGQDALNKIRAHPDTTLVITDMMMPEMSGIELISKIRDHFSSQQMSIIGMSGMEDRGQISTILKHGANDFFLKPYVYEEIFCRVAQCIDSITHYHRIKEYSIRDQDTGAYTDKYLMNVGGLFFYQAMLRKNPVLVALVKITNMDNLIRDF
ncbi:MAG: response regulator, partial [Bacteroidetes bacterium]|nr:response regulator [Bacteroidota bacterium]